MAGGAVRAAIYNRYWSSFGGGERHSGRIAAVLAADGTEVDLIGPEAVDPETLGQKLALDLSGVRMRVVPDNGDVLLAQASAEYDLFVNASYMSRLRPRAKRNAYLCYFPTPSDHDLNPLQRFALRSAGRYFRGRRQAFDHGLGWFPPEGGFRRRWTWTAGDAVLVIPKGIEPVLDAGFARVGRPGTATLRVEDLAGRCWARFEVGERFVRRRLRVGDDNSGTVLHLLSDTFVPGGGDNRTLGVAVSGLRVGSRRSVSDWFAFQFPWLLRDPSNVEFLRSYDAVLANSEYTRAWIRRLWGVDAQVLFPPVRLEPLAPAVERERVVAVVGRFFGPEFGHSKRQLEMVRIFGELHRRGALPGWRMRVVGGCEPSQEPYLRRVRAAASGLPVEVVANAPRRVVDEVFATASLFWSATGLGENQERSPWRFEHFGITTVEAMSGGTVPVVIDRAGQREIVRDGVDGFRWRTRDELVARTHQLAGDPELLARLGAAARERAAEFSEEAFDVRWRKLAGELGVRGAAS